MMYSAGRLRAVDDGSGHFLLGRATTLADSNVDPLTRHGLTGLVHKLANFHSTS